MCGSDGLSLSSSLLICGKSCRCQAENPLNALPSFTRPALTMASEARLYPGIAKPVFLLVWDYRQVRDRVHSRYPYLTSRESERQAIFGSMSGFVGVRSAASANAASHGAMDALGVKQI